MISYAQNGEDVILSRVLTGKSGFYIDVGACHPVIDSVTKHFFDLGFGGINIEPHPMMFARLQQDRTRDINLNLGISKAAGELTFYDCPSNIPLSTFDQKVAEDIRHSGVKLEERQVQVTTLDDVWLQNVPAETTVDFLKIDVEGHEKDVLEGLDLSTRRPRIIMVEATVPRSRKPDFESWEPLLLGRGYLFANFDGLNRYYVRDEEQELVETLAPPLCVFDRYIPFRQVANLGFLFRSFAESQDTDEGRERFGAFLGQLAGRPEIFLESPALLTQVWNSLVKPGRDGDERV